MKKAMERRKTVPIKTVKRSEEPKKTRFTLEEYVRDPKSVMSAAINTFITIIDGSGREIIMTMPRINAK